MAERPVAIPREIAQLERRVELINRFPDQNPNPVMRMTDDGILLYANPASADILAAWGVGVGDRLVDETLTAIRAALAKGDDATFEVVRAVKTYAVLPVAVPEFEFVNLYGTDITAAKVVARFPDRNPHPVFRVSADGVLLYANDASRQITWSFGCDLGKPLPADVRQKIVGALDGTGSRSFEVQTDGRTYQLLPVEIPEFGFINVYGTDVTAAKALDKFPDENPNPVMRVSRDGRLLYGNPASALIRKAWAVSVGDVLPGDVAAAIAARLEADSRDVIEVTSDDRIFAVLVRSIYEFGFTNLYGTDITAARQVAAAKEETELLLLNILPAAIADRLRAGEKLIADRHDDLTLLFADIVDFTVMSSRMNAHDVVLMLNTVFSLLDDLVDRHGLEKVKTIGDAYMVVGGLDAGDNEHTARVASMALELEQVMSGVTVSGTSIRFRIGIHRGPAVAGVIGAKKFIYDVWGDTVNTASRMESHSVPGRIQVTQAVVERLGDAFAFESRGLIEIKGKGHLPTWFLTGARAAKRRNARSVRRADAPVGERT